MEKTEIQNTTQHYINLTYQILNIIEDIHGDDVREQASKILRDLYCTGKINKGGNE